MIIEGLCARMGGIRMTNCGMVERIKGKERETEREVCSVRCRMVVTHSL